MVMGQLFSNLPNNKLMASSPAKQKSKRFRLETSHLCILAIFLTCTSIYIASKKHYQQQANNPKSMPDKNLLIHDYSESLFSFLSNNNNNNNNEDDNNNINKLLFSDTANKECRDYNHDIFGNNPLKEIPHDAQGIEFMLSKEKLKNNKIENNKNNDNNENINSKNVENNYGFIHILTNEKEGSGNSILFQIYGIFVFHGGLIRTKSKYVNKHIVLMPNNIPNIIPDNLVEAMKSIGINVIQFDPTKIDNQTPKNTSEHFHGIEAFRLTEYDRLVMIEHRQQILNNIDNIFTYVAPSAPPERWNGMESNTACFMFKPNIKTYDRLLKYLTKTNDWINSDNTDFDSFNTDRGTFQGFINAVYWEKNSYLGPIYQLGHEWALSTRKLANERARYFVEWRPSMLKMVEFIDEHAVDRTPRRKFSDRVDRMLKGESSQIDWYSTILTHYNVQYWLDFERAYLKCDTNYCNKIGFEFKDELEKSKQYKKQFGEPFPEIL